MNLETFLARHIYVHEYQQDVLFLLHTAGGSFFYFDGQEVRQGADVVPLLRCIKKDEGLVVTLARNPADFVVNVQYFEGVTFVHEGHRIIEKLFHERGENPRLTILKRGAGEDGGFGVFYSGVVLLASAVFQGNEVQANVAASLSYENLFNRMRDRVTLNTSGLPTQPVTLAPVVITNQLTGNIKGKNPQQGALYVGGTSDVRLAFSDPYVQFNTRTVDIENFDRLLTFTQPTQINEITLTGLKTQTQNNERTGDRGQIMEVLGWFSLADVFDRSGVLDFHPDEESPIYTPNRYEERTSAQEYDFTFSLVFRITQVGRTREARKEVRGRVWIELTKIYTKTRKQDENHRPEESWENGGMFGRSWEDGIFRDRPFKRPRYVITFEGYRLRWRVVQIPEAVVFTYSDLSAFQGADIRGDFGMRLYNVREGVLTVSFGAVSGLPSHRDFFTFETILEAMLRKLFEDYKQQAAAFVLDTSAIESSPRRFVLSNETRLKKGTAAAFTTSYEDLKKALFLSYGIALLHTETPEGLLYVHPRPYASLFDESHALDLGEVRDVRYRRSELAAGGVKIGFAKYGNIDKKISNNEVIYPETYTGEGKTIKDITSGYIGGTLGIDALMRRAEPDQGRALPYEQGAGTVVIQEVEKDNPRRQTAIPVSGLLIPPNYMKGGRLSARMLAHDHARLINSLTHYAGDKLHAAEQSRANIGNDIIFTTAEGESYAAGDPIDIDKANNFFIPVELDFVTSFTFRQWIDLSGYPYRLLSFFFVDAYANKYSGRGYIKQINFDIMKKEIKGTLFLREMLTKNKLEPFKDVRPSAGKEPHTEEGQGEKQSSAAY